MFGRRPSTTELEASSEQTILGNLTDLPPVPVHWSAPANRCLVVGTPNQYAFEKVVVVVIDVGPNSLKQDNAEHTPISHGPCLPLIPITDHEDAEFLSTPIAQSQPRDSPMDNEVCSNKDSPQQIHTQTDSPHTVSHDISHEPQDNPTSQPVDSSPLSTDHSAKAFLKFSSPTLGLANKKAVTGMSGLNGLTAMSVAFSVAMDAPKLAPVTVMLTFSSLYRSTSLATSSRQGGLEWNGLDYIYLKGFPLTAPVLARRFFLAYLHNPMFLEAASVMRASPVGAAMAA
nr:Os05g0574200 [Ipomoea batatas]